MRGNQHISQSSRFRDPAAQHNVNCYEHTVADNHPHTPHKTLSIFSILQTFIDTDDLLINIKCVCIVQQIIIILLLSIRHFSIQ